MPRQADLAASIRIKLIISSQNIIRMGVNVSEITLQIRILCVILPFMASNIDKIDRRILAELQNDSSQTQRAIADKVGLSQNACWRRLKTLESSGVIQRRTVVIDRQMLNVGLVVFVLIKTRHHSADWLGQFRRNVSDIPEVIDFFRIGGDYDYLLKIITRDMVTYDSVYKRLIQSIELDTVTSYFAMEAIEEQRSVALE